MERVEQIKEVKTKELNDGRILYLIFDSKGTEFSTMKRDLVRVAYDAVENGGYVHIDYAEKTNDRGFTNRYLNAIKAIDGDPMTTVGQAMRAAQAAQDDRPLGLFDDAAPAEPAIDREAEKNLSIAKAVGLKAAVDVMPLLPEDQRTVSNIQTAAEHFTRWLTTWRP